MNLDDRVACAEALRCLSGRLMRNDWPEREEGCDRYPLCDRVKVQLAAWASEKRTKENV